MPDENIAAPTTSDYKLNAETKVVFNGTCLIQDTITYDNGKVVNIYIVYEVSKIFNNIDYPTPEKCLFGAVSFTKYVDIDKYKFSGYGIGFNRNGIY